MCNPTMQPPRRDMYALEQTILAEKTNSTANDLDPKGSFILPKRPRIGTDNTTERIEIFNGNYSPSGKRIGEFPRPWNVLTPWDARFFTTHAEALQWVLQEARK